MRSGQQRSMQGLLQYIRGGKIDQEEVKKMIAAYVMPNLKLISYSLSEDKTKTALFMHAPNSFKAIEKMAGKFDAQDGLKNSAIDLAARIDKINGSFRLWCDKQLSEMLGTTDGMVNQFVWNRLEDTEGCIDFTSYPDFVDRVIHGHTTVGEKYDERQVNLDSNLGKSTNHHGEYLVFVTSANTPEVKQAKDWIKIVEDLTLTAADSRKDPLLRVASTAKKLLNGYLVKNRPEEMQTLFNDFRKELNNVQTLHLKELSWKNVFNIFCFIPSIVNYIKTGGQSFWLRPKQVAIEDTKKYGPLLDVNESQQAEHPSSLSV